MQANSSIEVTNSNTKLNSYFISQKLHVFCVMTYIVMMPLSIIAISSFGSAYKIASIVLIGLMLIVIFSNKYKTKAQISKYMEWWIVYVSYSLISLVWNTNLSIGYVQTIGLFQVFLLSMVFTLYPLDIKNLNKIQNAWIIMACILLLIFLFLGGRQQLGEFSQRYTLYLFGSSADPNELTGYFIVPLALLVNRLFDSKMRNKIIFFVYIVLILLMMYCVLLTGSRGGIIACIVSILVSCFAASKTKLRSIIKYSILILILGIIIVNFILPLLPRSTIYRLSINAIIADGGSNRNIIWNLTINRFLNNNWFRMFFGYGIFGTYPYRTMHNQILQILNDGGLIGVMIYVGFVINFFKIIKHTEYVGGFAGIMLLSMTITMYASYKPMWTLFMTGILVGISKSRNQQPLQLD